MTKPKYNDAQKKLMDQYKKDMLRVFEELPPLEEKTFSNERQRPLFELRKKFIRDMKEATK